MYLYFSAFMPGLFFEFSILLVNPGLGRQLVESSQEGFGLGHFLPLFIGLFLAFVIGNAFMFLVSHIQWLVGLGYRFCRFLWEKFQFHVLLPFLTKLTHSGPPAPAPTVNPGQPSMPQPAPKQRRPSPRWLSALYVRTVAKLQRVHSTEPTAAYEWWETLAKQLLLKRYGLSEEKLPATSFSPLQAVLTIPSAEEARGSILMNALHATGWAALFASRFAPALWNKWYIVFAVALIGFGLLHDYYVAMRLNDPDLGDILRLRAVLREFPRIRPTGTTQQNPAKPSGEEDDGL